MPDIKQKNSSAARARRARLRRKRRIRRNIWRGVLSVLTIVVLLLCGVLCAGWLAFCGPSQTVADLLTVSMLETSALKFVPRIYYSAAQVNEIILRNQVAEVTEEADTSLIVIAASTPEPTVSEAESPSASAHLSDLFTPEPTRQPLRSEDGIDIYEIKEGTYSGYMMVVHDPARVHVGAARDSFNGNPGLVLHEIAERYNAIAAINGGAFDDASGLGNGGKPIGLVISEGKLLHKANTSASRNIAVGFNEDNVLIFGKFTTDDAKKHKMRDALTFGPVLVYNGEPAQVTGASSGLNPRTAIGQRADGAVLMLVIDGRQANSLGATFADLIKIMLDFDAVNAVNLDGGSSSMLYYNGEYMNNGVALTGSRKLPTAFIVV